MGSDARCNVSDHCQQKGQGYPRGKMVNKVSIQVLKLIAMQNLIFSKLYLLLPPF